MKECIGTMSAMMVVIGFICTLLFGAIAILGDQQCSVACTISFAISMVSLIIARKCNR